ncbi:MAG: B12-binding domain-containing radical SAM protein [Chloroflexi bacterium]|nr:B12-binding domain-containing radical SAM protein [Chloroflexota bacterium]
MIDERMQRPERKATITLINPPQIHSKGSFPGVVFHPTGLAYVAAIMERAGHEVKVLDVLAESPFATPWNESSEWVGMTLKDIQNFLRSESPDIVGIGVPFTAQAEGALQVAAIVKKTNSRMTTILGGPHVTAYPRECLSVPDVDFVVMGEGEIPITNLLKVLEKGTHDGLGQIEGIGFKEGGQLRLNKMATPTQDLDSLPLPARHLLPMEKYFEAARLLRVGRLVNLYGKRFASIITSRGCPYTCTFCSIHVHMGRKYRFRSAENVVDEIQQLKERYGVNWISFEDDNLTLRRDRFGAICDLIIERGLSIKWNTPNGIRADTLDEELIRKMKVSGCTEICVAPESGNQWVVDHVVGKRMDLRKVAEVVKLCRKYGIRVDAFFVLGMIGETKSNMRDTIAFARELRRLGLTSAKFHIATPFQGTELREQADKMGYLRQKGTSLRLETPDFTCGDVDQLYREASKVNPIIPVGNLGLAMRILLTNPVQFALLSLNHLKGKRIA